MREYRIGEFARQTGLSVDILKHYEKLGLFAFRHDESNSYRYCDFADVSSLSVIKSLVSGDIPLRLGTAMEADSAETGVIASIDRIDRLVRQRMAFDRAVLRRTAEFRRALDALQDGTGLSSDEMAEPCGSACDGEPTDIKLGTWSLDKHGLYFLSFATGDRFLRRDEAELRELGQWWNLCPVAGLAALWQPGEGVEPLIGLVTPAPFVDEGDVPHAYARALEGRFFTHHVLMVEAGFADKNVRDISCLLSEGLVSRCVRYSESEGYSTYCLLIEALFATGGIPTRRHYLKVHQLVR